MRKLVFRFLIAVMIVISYNLPAFALHGDVIGVSLRASSMGEAFVAIADDYSATYYNPAGLGQITDTVKFTLDWVYQAPQFKVTNLNTGEDLKYFDEWGYEAWDPTQTATREDLNDIDHARPTIGLSANLTKICSALKIPINLNLGMIITLPHNGRQAMVLNDFVPDIPKYTRFGDPDEQIFAAFGLGAEVLKDLLFIGLTGKVELYGDGDIHNSDAGIINQGMYGDDGDGGSMVFEMMIDWRVFGRLTPIVGILFTPFDKKLKLGAVYREETEYNIGPCNMIMNYRSSDTENSAYIPWNGYMEFLFAYSPKELAAGIAYELNVFTVSFDLEFQQWSNFAFTAPQSNQYSNPDYPFVGYMPDSPDFSDIVNIFLGMEYRYSEKLNIMAGYRHMPTPVPDQSGRVTNYLDMDKDAFSLGCSYQLIKDFITIGAMFEYMKCEDYEVTKDGVTGWAWWYQESYKVEGDVYTTGLSLDINF